MASPKAGDPARATDQRTACPIQVPATGRGAEGPCGLSSTNGGPHSHTLLRVTPVICSLDSQRETGESTLAHCGPEEREPTAKEEMT